MSISLQITRSLGQTETVGLGGYPSDDEPRLIVLFHRLSPRTVYERFFAFRRLLPEEAHAFANVDYRRRMALVAEVDTGQEPELIGVPVRSFR